VTEYADVCPWCEKPFTEEQRHQHPGRFMNRGDLRHWRCGVDVPWQIAQHEADEECIRLLREAMMLW
jgi:hypothetical protein